MSMDLIQKKKEMRLRAKKNIIPVSVCAQPLPDEGTHA